MHISFFCDCKLYTIYELYILYNDNIIDRNENNISQLLYIQAAIATIATQIYLKMRARKNYLILNNGYSKIKISIHLYS